MLGTAWYPEQWPESRWDADLTLMQQAGIRMVRVGEFAWSRMEPSEGQYDLDWLDRAVTAASKHGIYTRGWHSHRGSAGVADAEISRDAARG